MKKIISLLAACAMFCAFLTACGDTNPAISGNDPEAAASTVSEQGSTAPKVDENEPITEEMLRAYPETPASDFEYSEWSEGIAIEKYIGSDPIVVIPAEIDGEPVTELYSYIFSTHYESHVRAVLIPASVECIPEGLAFNNEYFEIAICEGAKELDDLSFFCCPSLRTVILGDGVEEMGEMAFGSCPNLEKVRIPASLTSISEYDAEGMFYGSKEFLTIYGEAGSYIETFAAEQGIRFQAE